MHSIFSLNNNYPPRTGWWVDAQFFFLFFFFPELIHMRASFSFNFTWDSVDTIILEGSHRSLKHTLFYRVVVV